ncbi:MAG: LssY C-terminal domain-containing protein [Candidatus Solibacter usitatus]|nr:LssY C-terminal domain-containing protein [Candidatus Solibacter usitatus]
MFLAVWAAQALPAATIEAGARLEVRVRQPLSSYSSKAGSEILADLIAPVRRDGFTFLPQGSVLRGHIENVKAIGWGLKNLRASITLQFDLIELPDGTTHTVSTRVSSIDNSRESVDQSGRILGIRATAPFGHRLAGITRNLFVWDPLIQLVLAGSTAAVLRFPESEIYFPAGAELALSLEQPLELDTTWSTPLPRLASTSAGQARLLDLIRRMTYRSFTQDSRKPADYVNVVFLGDPEWIERAFDAAGWVHADRLGKKTGWMSFRSLAEARAYPAAPMSAMTLDERPARLQLSKTLNSYAQRHHLRVYDQSDSWNGRPVLAAASTQDIAVTWSFGNTRLIHVIDRNIDNERAKIVNDLVYTGCVDAAELIERPWVPAETRVATGQKIFTDGAVAVLELNPCRAALRSPLPGVDLRVSGGRGQRFGRRLFLTVGNDFTFNNPLYQAGLGAKWLWNRITGREVRTRPAHTPVLDPHLRSTVLAPPARPADPEPF